MHHGNLIMSSVGLAGAEFAFCLGLVAAAPEGCFCGVMLLIFAVISACVSKIF
jgi:hypothetical protein